MAKRKTLPKDFEAILASGDLAAMKAVFDKCEIDARGGYTKQTALAFACPDDLTRWLVAQGADLGAEDAYGETPLHAHAGTRAGRISTLLELGAFVNHGESGRGTPLHCAARAYKADAAAALIAAGARATVANREGQTPLDYALSRCSNINIENMVPLSEVLLAAMRDEAKPPASFLNRLLGGAKTVAVMSPERQAEVTRIGQDFEFSRSAFNPESVDAVSAALDKLYAIFDVTPVPRRAMYDGKTPIKVTAKAWSDQHDELWALLVPPQGAAMTQQGEAIRVSGRLHRELEGNGGVNWDSDFKAMADMLTQIFANGQALPAGELEEARALTAAVKRKGGDTARLCQLAVEWVRRNPSPLTMPDAPYSR
ncbi:hypothetical protein PQU92_02430 [Asticcacaulis sp. BYS171W]|uniref:Ankyrin repeat domain-containing protein n=1 Tax=Asticcacaulis aquaticus TaxID=2984212 RepID=A0ABT5HPX0_9CAUL|nr:ankyrin repeat domain-containing protein [Asticcacaulis aquaticus]MDC7682113.1 hypothetical protein [Asticcacaulis aquaticus]